MSHFSLFKLHLACYLLLNSFYVARLFHETGSQRKASLEELLPWVVALANLPKTHSAAWLQRVASQAVYEGNISGEQFSLSAMTEINFSAAVLIAHRDGDVDSLQGACGVDGDTAMSIYNYTNRDPLVFHAWQLQQRREELKTCEVNLPVLDMAAFESILSSPRELPKQWYDKHTREGKKMGRGYAHFFRILVLHPRLYPLPQDGIDREERGTEVRMWTEGSVREGHEPYEAEAKALYLDFKIDGKEVKSKDLLQYRAHKAGGGSDGSSGGGSAKKRKIDGTPEGKKMEEVGSGEVLRDVDVLDIDTDTVCLGFKNVTLLVRLRSPMHGWRAGDLVFMKMGESAESCRFAVCCDHLRRQLGLTTSGGAIGAGLVYLVPTLPYGEMAGRQNPLWARGVSDRLEKAKRLFATEGGALPCLLQSAFDGERLCDRWREWEVNGMELLQVLLFRKYLGVADTNATNLMVNMRGAVLSVDETPASDAQIAKYHAKGLVTSQAMHRELLAVAAGALYSAPDQVAAFLQRLKQLCLEADALPPRLASVHCREPFDDHTLRWLSGREGLVSDNDLKKFAKRLRLVS